MKVIINIFITNLTTKVPLKLANQEFYAENKTIVIVWWQKHLMKNLKTLQFHPNLHAIIFGEHPCIITIDFALLLFSFPSLNDIRATAAKQISKCFSLACIKSIHAKISDFLNMCIMTSIYHIHVRWCGCASVMLYISRWRFIHFFFQIMYFARLHSQFNPKVQDDFM